KRRGRIQATRPDAGATASTATTRAASSAFGPRVHAFRIETWCLLWDAAAVGHTAPRSWLRGVERLFGRICSRAGGSGAVSRQILEVLRRIARSEWSTRRAEPTARGRGTVRQSPRRLGQAWWR